MGFTDIRELPVAVGQDGASLVGPIGEGLNDGTLDWCYLPPGRCSDDIFCEPVPRYTTDPVARKVLVEEMSRRGFKLVVADWRHNDFPLLRQWAAVYTWPFGYGTGEVLAELEETAVALAALKAVETK